MYILKRWKYLNAPSWWSCTEQSLGVAPALLPLLLLPKSSGSLPGPLLQNEASRLGLLLQLDLAKKQIQIITRALLPGKVGGSIVNQNIKRSTTPGSRNWPVRRSKKASK